MGHHYSTVLIFSRPCIIYKLIEMYSYLTLPHFVIVIINPICSDRSLHKLREALSLTVPLCIGVRQN